MATLFTGFWMEGTNLLPGQTHHYFQDLPPSAHGSMHWFVAQPVQDPIDPQPEQALEVTVYYLNKANSNDLQVNVLVQNIGTNTAAIYDIYYATTQFNFNKVRA